MDLLRPRPLPKLARPVHLAADTDQGVHMTADTSRLETVTTTVRDPFLNTDDACRYLGVPKATLLTWRVRRPGYGPRAVKAGGRLKYRLSELDRWVDAHEDSVTDDPVEAAQTSEDEPALPTRPAVRTRHRASQVRNRT